MFNETDFDEGRKGPIMTLELASNYLGTYLLWAR